MRVEKLAPIGEQINIVQKMADHAPKDIAKDTETFLDALQRRGRRRQVGGRQPQDQGRGRQREPASVARGCELFKQEPGSGI